MSPELLANVAVRAPVEHSRLAILTYRIPLRLRRLIQAGQLVWVPLRRQRVQGVVLDTYADDSATPAGENVREIADLGDAEARVTPSGIQLARWIATTYRTPLYDALALLLPPGVAQQAEVTWRATPMGLLADLGALPERERGVLYYLRHHGETSERDMRRELRGSDADLLATYGDLHERGLLARGATLSTPRVQPRMITLARLLLDDTAVDSTLATLGRAPKQAAALRWLAQTTRELTGDGAELVVGERDDGDEESVRAHTPAVPTSAIAAATGVSLAMLRSLETRGVLALETREIRRDPLAGDGVAPDVPPPLTSGQRAVWEKVSAALERLDKQTAKPGTQEPAQQTDASAPDHVPPPHQRTASTFLLHGVTGSGKTEIYLRAIGRALRMKRQTLVLVPEIALTAQLVRRFAARFPGQIAVLHSGLSLGQRYDEWRRLRRGEARLAIGSRSAIFAPLSELGLIIVDEEHESTYKHDSAPRYHARDAALQLAAITGSVLILGSATPSVESYAAAERGQYGLLEMRERVGTAPSVNGLPRSRALPLPPVRLIDMRHELQTGNRSIFSLPLQEALAKTLERREQAILFLNRRGVASFVMCRDCGHVITCPVCSGPLVVHHEENESSTKGASRRVYQHQHATPTDATALHTLRDPSLADPAAILMCHSCNHRELVPLTCPQCLSQRIKAFGIGTQRVEEEVVRLFPEARALRWDRDSVGQKGAHQRLLDAFLNHDADVLVGTQMIAKGLDLPLVSLVGVVAADTGLHLPDFRSGERAFQLLTQVAGRAGRRTTGANVILQTYNPEHYALRAAQEHDYQSFYIQEIAFRRQTGYPPFGRLVRFVCNSGSEERCVREAHELADRVRALLVQRDDPEEWLIGPAPAFIQRVRGRYRWHLLVRTASPGTLLDGLGPLYGWAVDVDPVNVL